MGVLTLVFTLSVELNYKVPIGHAQVAVKDLLHIFFYIYYTVKPVCNDHHYNKIYYVLMKTEGTNLLLLTISAFWSSSRWPWATEMSSKRHRSIPLGGRYRQVSLYWYTATKRIKPSKAIISWIIMHEYFGYRGLDAAHCSMSTFLVFYFCCYLPSHTLCPYYILQFQSHNIARQGSVLESLNYTFGNRWGYPLGA